MYTKLVIEPLKEFESSGLGRVRDISPDDLIKLKSFQTESNLFVSAVHHAIEIFATYQSILQAISGGVQVNTVPVVNVLGFNYVNKKIEDLEKLAEKYGGRIYDDLLRQIFFCFNETPFRDIIYPQWTEWNYGREDYKKNVLAKEIEKIVEKSSFVIDIHNCSTSEYMIITSPAKSSNALELQQDIENIVQNSILDNGNGLLRNSDIAGFREIRNGIYELCSNEPTLIQFAKEIGIANICLETPVYDKYGNFYPFNKDKSRILSTNVELISKVSEHINSK